MFSTFLLDLILNHQNIIERISLSLTETCRPCRSDVEVRGLKEIVVSAYAIL